MILGLELVAVRVFLSLGLIRIKGVVDGWIRFGLSRVSEISISLSVFGLGRFSSSVSRRQRATRSEVRPAVTREVPA
jgi:hypothetical protein